VLSLADALNNHCLGW